MHDNISRIDKHPIATLLAFNRNCFVSRVFKRLDHMVRKRADMTRRRAACDDHQIGKVGFLAQVNGGDVFGFVSVEGFGNKAFEDGKGKFG